MKNVDGKVKIIEALGRSEFLSLATTGKDGVWVCPVQYFYDKKLNFYWSSMLDTKHSLNISEFKEVALAIYKTEKFPGDGQDVMGLQLKGTAELVLDENTIRIACEEYGEITGHAERVEKMKVDLTKAGRIWHVFKFTPSEIWLFDSRDFDEVRVQIDFKNIVF